MLGPNKQDIQKIHSEVNQLVNQRLSLTTLAVTIFGAIIAWSIPKVPLAPNVGLGAFVYAATFLLILILFSLFLLTHYLSIMLRIFTTYLDESDASNWEKDWATFRTRHKFWRGYTKPQSVIFLLLGVLTTIFPFVLAFVYSANIQPYWGAIICSLAGLFYLIFVYGMGFLGWFGKEEEVRQKWKSIKKKKK